MMASTVPRWMAIMADIMPVGAASRPHYHRRGMHPLERLVNLTALMLTARRPLTFEDIRDRIEAYQHQDGASAKRMFERDKDILRDIGVPVELVATDPWDVEKGYRIVEDQYYLPDLSFTPDELWALFVAAHAPGEDEDAEHAFRKLAVGADEGLKHESSILCDALVSLPKSGLTDFVGALAAGPMRKLTEALRVALALE